MGDGTLSVYRFLLDPDQKKENLLSGIGIVVIMVKSGKGVHEGGVDGMSDRDLK